MLAVRSRRATGAALAALILAVLACAGLGHAASARAADRLAFGMTDDNSFELSPASVEATWLSRAYALGSRWVRMNVYWFDVAPYSRPRRFREGDPRDRNYNWGTLDQAIREAVAHGQTVLLTVNGTPSWAEGRGKPAGVERGTWFPNPRDYAAFGHALAERYSGHFREPGRHGRVLPRVRYFQAWNEPNLPNYLMPQWGRSPHGAWEPVSPGIYRSLLNAFYGAVKSVQPDSVVLSAGTGPYGDPPARGEGRMRPVTFLKALFCLTPGLRPAGCSDPPHLDAVDHHPYSIGPTVPARNGGDISVPDLDKIRAIVNTAARYGRVIPDGPKPLWVTEIDWTSGGTGASPTLQAADLSAAFYEFWRQDVSHAFWFELSDPPPRQTNSFSTAGLYYATGVPKPAAAAYRFPFAAVWLKRNRRAVWGRAPRRGRVSIQELVGSRWRQVASLRTGASGIFYTVRPFRKGVELRAVIGRDVSPVYVVGNP